MPSFPFLRAGAACLLAALAVRPQPPGSLAVAEVPDVAYRDARKADPIRHRADLFLPRGRKGFPVVVPVHGGTWVMGDNRCCGLYSSVGHFLASQGYGVVLPNYRLAPAAPHPAPVQDVARAVAWTRRHIAEYGGGPRRIYHRALLRAGCKAELRTVERRNHSSVLFSAIRPDAPTARAVLDFLREQEKGK